MANIKSAQKRIDTIERRNQENRFVRATLSTKVKKLRKMIEEGKIAEAETFSKEVYAYIDSACSKGVIHKNAASRKVGRLAAAMYKAKASAPATKEKAEKVEKVEEVKAEATPVVEEAPAKKTTKRTTTKKAATAEKEPAKKTTRKTTTKKEKAE
ncbi:MAG: 30S ribosomal protein S20 [Clostridiales bacterium]|nr:30S ribosomal protein S20 [Clostridiales bacterium]